MTTLIAHNRGDAKSLEARFYLQGRSGFIELRYYHSTFGIEGDRYVCVRWQLPEALQSFKHLKTAPDLADELMKPGIEPTLLGGGVSAAEWISHTEELENQLIAIFELTDGTKLILDFAVWDSFVDRLVKRSREVELGVASLVHPKPEVTDRSDPARRFQLFEF